MFLTHDQLEKFTKKSDLVEEKNLLYHKQRVTGQKNIWYQMVCLKQLVHKKYEQCLLLRPVFLLKYYKQFSGKSAMLAKSRRGPSSSKAGGPISSLVRGSGLENSLKSTQ